MRHEAMQVGAIYRVRFARGVVVLAQLVESLGKVAVPGSKGAGRRPRHMYRMKLVRSVGTTPKGYTFDVSALAVQELASAPPDNHVGSPQAAEEALTPPPVPQEAPSPPEATPVPSFREQQETLRGQPEAVADTFKMGVPLQVAVNPQGRKVVAELEVTVPVEDLATLFLLLEDYGYSPTLRVRGVTP
jgi:hypothetical protein